MAEEPVASRAEGVLAGAGVRSRRAVISFLILAMLYQNVEAMFNTWQVRIARSTLPNVRLLENLFFMYGVFSNLTTHPSRYAAFGSRVRHQRIAAEPMLDMIELDLYRYFPQQRGEASRRLGFSSYRWQPERRVAGYRSIADILQRDYNRAHPQAPLA